MKSLDELHPSAWDALTEEERHAIAVGDFPSGDVVRKLLPFSVVIHVQWPETPDSGGWMVVGRFSDYVRDRLAEEESRP